MARNRANINSDQTAYVGDLRFGPGQLLPVGTVEYQVYGYETLEPGQGQPRGVKGLVYSITVPVGTSKADIEEAISAFVELALADPEYQWDQYDDTNGLDLFDEPSSPENVQAPELPGVPFGGENMPSSPTNMTLDEYIEQSDEPIALPDGSENWTLEQYFDWRKTQ
jgi:hypothetical protein